MPSPHRHNQGRHQGNPSQEIVANASQPARRVCHALYQLADHELGNDFTPNLHIHSTRLTGLDYPVFES
jgi:hypothetical protein